MEGYFGSSFLTSHFSSTPHLHTESMDIIINGTRLPYAFTTKLYVFSLLLTIHPLCAVDKEDTTPTTQPPLLYALLQNYTIHYYTIHYYPFISKSSLLGIEA
jgi:hypothetical protein